MAIDWTQKETAADRLAARRSDAVKTVVARIQAAEQAITGLVPEAERASWGAKEAAARAVLAGSTDPSHTSILDAEAAATGETREQLAALVAANATAFKAATGALTGARRVARDAILAATDVAGIDAALTQLDLTLAHVVSGGQADE